MVDLVFRLRYCQRFYRDWLVVEMGPRLPLLKNLIANSLRVSL